MCHSPKTLLQVHVGTARLRPEARACKGLGLGLQATEAGSQGHREGGERGSFILGEHQLSKFQTQVVTRRKHVILSWVLLG